MKKTLTLTAILLLVMAVGVAQDTATSAGTQSSEQSIRGCLSGSEGNFTLTADGGQTFKLSGDDAKLKEHVGHMVEIKGMPEQASSDASAASSGSSAASNFAVNDVQMIAETCTSDTASAGATSSDPNAVKTEEENTGNVAQGNIATSPGTAPDASASATTTTPDASASAAGTTTTPDASASATTTPDYSNTTSPSTGVASGSAATSTEATGMQQEQATQEPAASAAATTGTSATAADQSQAPVASTPETDAAAAADQGAQQDTEVAQSQLPQTASPLPLLGLLGLGSLLAGFVARRKK